MTTITSSSACAVSSHMSVSLWPFWWFPLRISFGALPSRGPFSQLVFPWKRMRLSQEPPFLHWFELVAAGVSGPRGWCCFGEHYHRSAANLSREFIEFSGSQISMCHLYWVGVSPHSSWSFILDAPGPVMVPAATEAAAVPFPTPVPRGRTTAHSSTTTEPWHTPMATKPTTSRAIFQSETILVSTIWSAHNWLHRHSL